MPCRFFHLYLNVAFATAVFYLTAFLQAELGLGGYQRDLEKDLQVVEWVNCHLNNRMPVYFNHLLYGGYWNMPSSRMGKEGDIGIGWSHVPPYDNYNLRLQLFKHVELSGNYRVFRGVEDHALSKHGFGDFSDKGANVKAAFWFPEDSQYSIPGFAIGWEDFLGTKAFEARYAVLTQVFPDWNLELSLGYGDLRINGWFGGVAWMPFRNRCNSYLKDLALVAEYDAIPYKSKSKEPHPEGRTVSSPINFGIKYRLWDCFDFSGSYVRGEKWAFSLSSFFSLGTCKGIMPKIENPLPYSAPRIFEPIGPLRPCDVLVQELYSAFEYQGMSLMQVWLSSDQCGQSILRLEVENCTWRYEDCLRERLSLLLAYLVPNNVDYVVVELQVDGLPIQEYHYKTEYLRLFADSVICPYEFSLLNRISEVSRKQYCDHRLIYKESLPRYCIEIFPKTYTAFGSAKGKFKYLLGVNFGACGYFWGDWYYSLLFGYPLVSNLHHVTDVDKINPSQLVNVRTDSINYYKHDGLTVDEAYIEKNWNLGKGNYFRTALGLFEEAYGGIAGEWLYYPVSSRFAVGIEGAYLRKRTYTGVGFTDRVRKLKGYTPTYVEPFYPSQYFVNFYYNFEQFDLDLELKGGKFLANDWGVRSEFSRYYPSGLRLYAWYTYTDGRDRVNGHIYYDKGIGFSIPLDIFLPRSCCNRYRYSISAWLRDVGAISLTGNPLYWKIRNQREQCITY